MTAVPGHRRTARLWGRHCQRSARARPGGVVFGGRRAFKMRRPGRRRAREPPPAEASWRPGSAGRAPGIVTRTITDGGGMVESAGLRAGLSRRPLIERRAPGLSGWPGPHGAPPSHRRPSRVAVTGFPSPSPTRTRPRRRFLPERTRTPPRKPQCARRRPPPPPPAQAGSLLTWPPASPAGGRHRPGAPGLCTTSPPGPGPPGPGLRTHSEFNGKSLSH